MDSIPRPKSLRSRNLFTHLDLQPGHKSTRSIRQLPFKLQHSKTSRIRISNTDQNEQPLNHTFKWVIDKSSSYKQNEQKNLSETLTRLKKTLNLRLTESNRLVEKMKRVKEYARVAKEEVGCYETSAAGLKQRIKETEGRIEERKGKQEEVQLDQKILENMLNRMRLDKMYYGLEEKHKEKILKYKTIEDHHYDEKKMSLENMESFIGLQLIDLQAEFGRLEHNREIQVSSAKNAIKKQVRQRINIQQRRDIPSICDLHPRKMLLIQMMLNQVLRCKILRLTEKHKRLDINFRKIKVSTNINNLDDLVQKYFSEENMHEKLNGQVKVLEKQMRESQEKSLELKARLKKLQSANLMEGRYRKFIKVVSIEQQNPYQNGRMDIISLWINNKSRKLKVNTLRKSPQQTFIEICKTLQQFAMNKQQADEYFNSKFFSEGISIKKQPKLLSMSRQHQRLAMLNNNLRGHNQAEMEHFNKIRVNVLRHHKSKTEG